MQREFKNYLILTIGLSESTVKNILSRINTFINFSKEDYSQEKLNNFFLNLKTTVDAGTFNNYVKDIRKFLTFKQLNLQLPKYQKLTKKVPEIFNEEDLIQKIIPIIECNYRNPLKLKAVLCFLFYVGVRKQEFHTLKRENFNLEKKNVKIQRTKSYKEQVLPIPESIIPIIKEYFAFEPEISNAFNMSKGSLDKALTKLKPYFKDFNLHAHLFRKGYTRYLILNGLNLGYVQKALGHEDIKTTAKYFILSDEDLQKEFHKRIK